MNRETLIESIAEIIGHASGKAKCCGCYADNAAKLVVEYLATGATEPWKYEEPDEERLARQAKLEAERIADAARKAESQRRADARLAAIYDRFDRHGSARATLDTYGWMLSSISEPFEQFAGSVWFNTSKGCVHIQWTRGQNPFDLALENARLVAVG